MADLASKQHGVVARWQLLDAGFERHWVDRAIALRRLHPLYRGVYAVGHRMLPPRGRPMAAVLACGAGALLSHRSAADLWQIARTARARFDVTIGRSGRRRPGIDIHNVCDVDSRDRTVVDAIPVTTLARTLLDYAGVSRRPQVERAIEEAERLRILDVRAIDELLARSPGRRGARTLSAVLADQRDAPHTKRELERLFLDVCRRAGLPDPVFNALVLGYEVDAHWPGTKAIVELDSWQFHRTRSAFERDRERDLRLKGACYEVVRVTWRALQRDPDVITTAIRNLLVI